MDNRLNNAVNEFLQIKGELYDNYGIIDISESSSYSKPNVQVSGKENLLKIADNRRVTIFDRKDKDYPNSLIFEDVENGIVYEALMNKEEHHEYVTQKKQGMMK